jgi:phosphodiesterase/alkaline phosphatase D-like protein
MGKQAFREYHGRGNPDPIVPGEIYYTLQFGDVGVFMTDTRSFRSCQQGADSLVDILSGPVTINFSGTLGTATSAAWNAGAGFTPGLVGRTLRLGNGQTRYITAYHSPTQISVSAPVAAGSWMFLVHGKTILGATQKQHLKNWLLQNNEDLRVKFIGSSTPINGLSEHITAKDAWGAGYQAELNEILDFVVTNRIRNVVFLTGDQHWSGSFNRSRGDVNFFEFMSSPIYSGGYPKYPGSDSNLLARVNWMFDANMGRGTENFGVVTVRTDTSPATVRFDLLDAGGVMLNTTALRESPSGLVIDAP